MKSILLVLLCLSSSTIVASDKSYGAPKGGFAVSPDNPIWISGLTIDDAAFTKEYPKREQTEHLAVVNAGLWLANNGPKISILVYSLEIDIKKPFSKKVFTKTILPNPENPGSPFIYKGTLNKTEKSTRVNHNPVVGIKKGEKYNFVFEVYEDKKRNNLIERIDQQIQSPVDNTSGCVEIEADYKKALFGDIKDKRGRPIPPEKIVVACKK